MLHYAHGKVSLLTPGEQTERERGGDGKGIVGNSKDGPGAITNHERCIQYFPHSTQPFHKSNATKLKATCEHTVVAWQMFATWDTAGYQHAEDIFYWGHLFQ